METVKYYSTIGMNAVVPGFKIRKLVRISCDKLSDGTRKCYVKSGHSLSVIDRLGITIISQEEADQLFDDNDVHEFINLAGLFGIEV